MLHANSLLDARRRRLLLRKEGLFSHCDRNLLRATGNAPALLLPRQHLDNPAKGFAH